MPFSHVAQRLHSAHWTVQVARRVEEGQMLRILMACLLTVLAAACTIGLPSAVDAAPFEARMAEAPFADGVYCKLTKGEDDQLLVTGQASDNEDGCSDLTWDAGRRFFIMRDGYGKEVELKLVDLGDGFFMMQLPSLSSADDVPFSFTLMAGAAQGAVVAILPIGYGEETAPVGARHPNVVLSTYKPSRVPFTTIVAPEGAVPPPEPDAFYISSGSPTDIRDLARDLLSLVLTGGKHPPQDAREWKGEGMLVRDQPSQADHAPSAAQVRDIEAMIAKLLAQLPPQP
jgi:hypothetical protein